MFLPNDPMKKVLLFSLCLIFTLSVYSQDRKNIFQRIRDRYTTIVYDTIYIYQDTTGTYEDNQLAEEEIDEESESRFGNIPVPFDTLDTDDKYHKVVLFDDNTWAFFDITKPILPDTLDSDHWDTDQVHTYRDVDLKNLPDEVDLVLIDSLHGYCIPNKGQIVSEFKYRGRRPHKGVDIDLDLGDPVYAAFDGVVRVALPTRYTGGYGNVLVIRHANGLETYYGHLSKYIVNSGDVVTAGELIGYGGSTGRSTGPHLHFETRYMGQPFDPQRIFDFENGILRCTVFTLRKHYFSINSHYGQSDKESLAASKAPAPKPAAPKAVYHKVRKGDTLGGIARKYHTTVKKLCKLNGIRETKVLQIGQRIKVR